MLVNTKKMFENTYAGGYAIGAFNVNNMELVQAITEAASEINSPVILQASAGARKYAGNIYLKKIIEAAVQTVDIPIAAHLDHGESFEICKECIDNGFTSVMIDGSSLPFDENVKLTKKVVEYAHNFDVTVEGELGRLCGIEDSVTHHNDEKIYTSPEQAAEFVQKTGVDSLAIAIGTSHGAYKFKPNQKMELRFDILEKIEKLIPKFPIVLHGASSISKEDIETINLFGGKIENAVGIPEEMLKKACGMAVCKVNIDSDIRLAITASIRKYLNENPSHFDPRQYLNIAKLAAKSVVKNKIRNVLGSRI